jgi:hypothetical protein
MKCIVRLAPLVVRLPLARGEFSNSPMLTQMPLGPLAPRERG